MSGIHARLSPSSSSRWLNCGASVRLAAKLPPDPGSSYAAEGTNAHTVAEYLTRLRVLKESPEPLPFTPSAEMFQHGVAYADLIGEELAARNAPGVLLLEQSVPTGVPECFGTADAVIVFPDEIVVIDYKYGAGVPVNVEENSQLMLYGIGALEQFGDLVGDIKTVTLIIHQPRIGDGTRSTWQISADDLRAWRDSIIPTAQLALAEGATFVPSEAACRWCPASGVCSARKAHLADLAFNTHDPDELTPEQMAEILDKAGAIRAWLTAVESAAFSRVYTGSTIPGYKIVTKGGRRYVPDAAALVQVLIDAGFTAEQVADFKAKPFGHLESLVGGRKKFDLLVGDLVQVGSGKPSLVKSDDPAPAVDRESEVLARFD